MSKETSKISAILNAKCPQCREGDMFKSNAYNLGHFSEMNEYCKKCHFHFEVEPGFFIGSMFISYAFTVAVFIVFGFATYFILDDPDVWVYMAVILTVILITLPVNFRYSRILMLYLFGGVNYKSKQVEEK